VQDYIAEGDVARQFQVSSTIFNQEPESLLKCCQIESAAEDARQMQKDHAEALAHMTVRSVHYPELYVACCACCLCGVILEAADAITMLIVALSACF
jgi:hypothetical protein